MSTDPIPASADDAWLTPWLNWLEAVENRAGIHDFGPGERGEQALEHLHEMFLRDASHEEAATWLESNITKGPCL